MTRAYTASEIQKLLGHPQPGGLHLLEEVDSTMEACRRLGEAGAPEGAAVLAEHQTAGVGRMGRSFDSPAGDGVYCSLLLRPRREEALQLLTSYAGLAACRALERAAGCAPAVKWPNDLILNGKKVCGILTRLHTARGGEPFVVVGIGVNVCQTAFPEELADKAISLAMAGSPVDRAAVAAALLGELDRIFLEERSLASRPPEMLEELRRRSCTLGRQVMVSSPGNGGFSGIARDLDPLGGLIVETPEGLRTVTSGEASVRGLWGYLPKEG